jgi:RND superfamily putative drug exporter
VITAAGVILAATFAALAQLPSVSVTEVGTAIAIGVLLDTLPARSGQLNPKARSSLPTGRLQ